MSVGSMVIRGAYLAPRAKWNPLEANARAIPSPIPPEAPVINATRCMRTSKQKIKLICPGDQGFADLFYCETSLPTRGYLES